jgi:hypothetical protein
MVAPDPTVCMYTSPRMAGDGSDVAVGNPILSLFPSNPPSGDDPGPTNTGIVYNLSM